MGWQDRGLKCCAIAAAGVCLWLGTEGVLLEHEAGWSSPLSAGIAGVLVLGFLYYAYLSIRNQPLQSKAILDPVFFGGILLMIAGQLPRYPRGGTPELVSDVRSGRTGRQVRAMEWLLDHDVATSEVADVRAAVLDLSERRKKDRDVGCHAKSETAYWALLALMRLKFDPKTPVR